MQKNKGNKTSAISKSITEKTLKIAKDKKMNSDNDKS